MTFSVTVKTGISMKCWWTMPIPARDGIAGGVDVDWLAADDDLALIRLVEAVQDVHQGGFAGAILPQQGMDLALLEGQVDMIIGQHTGETLGDVRAVQGQEPWALGNQAGNAVIVYRGISHDKSESS